MNAKTYAILLFATIAFAIVMFSMEQPHSAHAQTASPTATPGFAQNVQVTLFACPDAVAVQFSGNLLAGWDIYYQVFNGASTSGTTLTGVRRISANGTFSVGERVALPTGTSLSNGAAIFARVFIASETNSSNIDFEFTLSDTYDVCDATTPTNTATSTVISGGTVTTSTTASTRSVFFGKW